MSGTSSMQPPLSNGKTIIPAQNTDHRKWTSKEQNLCRATKILCSHLILLYKGYTVQQADKNATT